MRLAMEEANTAAARDEVPVGAILVRGGRVVARNGNRTRELHDPTAHAEVLVIREGCRLAAAQRIPDCDLYVTLEPCALCAAAIAFARIRRLIIGARDAKGGGVWHGSRFFAQSTCHHRPEIAEGLLAMESSALLKKFFLEKRKQLGRQSR